MKNILEQISSRLNRETKLFQTIDFNFRKNDYHKLDISLQYEVLAMWIIDEGNDDIVSIFRHLFTLPNWWQRYIVTWVQNYYLSCQATGCSCPQTQWMNAMSTNFYQNPMNNHTCRGELWNEVYFICWTRLYCTNPTFCNMLWEGICLRMR
jgi:hypothetical protein